jgi:hypothetical protein
MLDELINHYGAGAVLTVRPYVLDSGETLRWVVAIDGKDVPDADIRIDVQEGAAFAAIILVRGKDELEITRWPTNRPEPAEIVDTLGGLRRRHLD